MEYIHRQVEQALENAEASLLKEEMQPTEEEKQLCRQAILENMSDEEFMREVLRRCTE